MPNKTIKKYRPKKTSTFKPPELNGNQVAADRLWKDLAEQLTVLLGRRASDPEAPVFVSASGRPLTRFGIYKRVRDLRADVETTGSAGDSRRVSPHVWRHYVLGPTMSIDESESGEFLREFGFARYEVWLEYAT